MSTSEHTIAGLPAEKFVNRRVRLKNKHGGHRKTATLKEILGNGTAVVKPDQHKDTDTVDLEDIHPWWVRTRT